MFLAFFIPALWGALAAMMASLVGRAVLALGIGFVTYTGTMVVITGMENLIMNNMTGMPVLMVNFLGFMWVDKAVTVIFSAVAASIAIRGIGGSVKRMIFK